MNKCDNQGYYLLECPEDPSYSLLSAILVGHLWLLVGPEDPNCILHFAVLLF